MRKYWNKSYVYKTLMEILEDYWLTEKDEAKVFIHLEFRHKDGRLQMKDLRWVNPELVNHSKKEIKLIRLADMESRFEPKV